MLTQDLLRYVLWSVPGLCALWYDPHGSLAYIHRTTTISEKVPHRTIVLAEDYSKGLLQRCAFLLRAEPQNSRVALRTTLRSRFTSNKQPGPSCVTGFTRFTCHTCVSPHNAAVFMRSSKQTTDHQTRSHTPTPFSSYHMYRPVP